MIVFTSMRDGDLGVVYDGYESGENMSNALPIRWEAMAEPGSSPDGQQVILRRHVRKTDEEIAEYKSLLSQNLVADPIWKYGSPMWMAATPVRSTWSRPTGRPTSPPDGRHFLFCSNHEYKRGFPFNMYMADLDGSNIRKISRDKGFDAFPCSVPMAKDRILR